MKILLVYLLLLKATVTSFSGTGSLPQIRTDFVQTYHLVSDEDVSQALLIGRATPGPMGAYVVAVGYRAAGVAGGIAGWLAMITPAFAALPLLVTVQRWIHLRRMRAMVDALVIAGAALLIPAGLELALDGLRQLGRVFSG